MDISDVDAFFTRIAALDPTAAWPLLQLVDARSAAAKAVVLSSVDLKRAGHRMAAEAHISKGALVGKAKDAKLLIGQPRVMEELTAGRRSPTQATELATSLVGVEPGLAAEMVEFVLENVGPAEPPKAHRILARALVDQTDQHAARERRAKALQSRKGVRVDPLDDDLAVLTWVDRADVIEAGAEVVRHHAQLGGDPRDRPGGWPHALADAFYERVTGHVAQPGAWPEPDVAGTGEPEEPDVALFTDDTAGDSPPRNISTTAGTTARPSASGTTTGRPTGPAGTTRTRPAGAGRWRNSHRPPPQDRTALVTICHRQPTDTHDHDVDDEGGSLPEATLQQAPTLWVPTRSLEIPTAVVPARGPVRLIASSNDHGDLHPAGGELLGVGAVHHVSLDVIHAYLDQPSTRIQHVLVTRRGRLAEPAPWTDPDQPEASTAMRAHIRLRDRTCRGEGCSVPAARTDLEHLKGRHAGCTRCDLLWCLCNTHHQGEKHTRGATAEGDTDGTVRIRTPDGRRYDSTPAVVDPATRYGR